jgi:glycosyltransferase involved in cell wall biosynthesis
MKILLVSQDDSQLVQVGGKHIHQNILIAAWRSAGHDVRCCFPHDNPLKLSVAQRIAYRLTRGWGRYPARYFARYLDLIRQSLKVALRARLADWQPDVISAQDPMAAIACAEVLDELKLAIRAPITLTLHGYYTWEMFNYGYYGEQNRQAIEAIGFALEGKALARIARVVTVDSRIRDYLRNQFSFKGKLDVVFNAIDLAPFSEAPARSGAAPATWQLLITRRMVLKNGVIVAVEALAEVLRQAPNVQLVMVGDGPEMENVRQRARKFGVEDSIEFVGAVTHNEIPRYYLQADILLMPSIPSDNIEEATSLSMLEGMAAGNLVICSGIGGMKEIVRNGENGFLVAPADPVALANQILAIINSDSGSRKDVIQRAREYAWANHAGEKHAMRILALMVDA